MLYDVLILGAGLSGLICADRILTIAPSCKVCVLESKDRVGGRTKSALNGTSSLVIDEGGMWIGPRHVEMLKLCQRFNLQFIYQESEGKDVWLMKEKEKYLSNQSHDDYPDLGFLTRLELKYRVLAHLEKLSEAIDLENPTKLDCAQEYDSYSLHSYFKQLLWTERSLFVLNDLSRALFGCESSQVSFLFALWSLKSGGGLEYTSSVSNGAQERRIRGGVQQISENLVLAVQSHQDCKVFLNSHVTQVNYGADGIYTVRTALGVEYQTRYLVCSGNASVVVRDVRFEPRLPIALEQFGQRTFRGSYGKVIVEFKSPFWKQKGYSGVIMNSRPNAVVCSSMDYSDTENSYFAIVCFLAGNPGLQLAELSVDDRRNGVIKDLCEAFDEDYNMVLSNIFVSYHEVLWHTDPVIQGCSGLVYPPGQFVLYHPSRLFSEPIFNQTMYFVGTDVTTHFSGYMEGAATTGVKVGEKLGNILAHA